MPAPDKALRDCPFNPWRVPASERLNLIVCQACNDVEAYEKQHDLRERRRKSTDQETFEKTVTALLCDVIYHYLSEPSMGIFVSRSNSELGGRSRYRAPALNKKLPSILDALASPELGYLIQVKGDNYLGATALRTVIKAGPTTLQKIAALSVSVGDIGEARYQEPIVLKAEKERRQDKGKYLSYEDTDTTTEYRRQINVINDWLEASTLSIDRQALQPSAPTYSEQKRRLRRVFTRGSFESGGRLFGGFWQDMSKEHRLPSLSISGEPIAELDYGQVSPRILYGCVGAEPPTEDIYDILLLNRARRDGIKKV